jgi:CRP/FNR family transcriptional regulator, transcriptional activator FtrB
MSLSASYLNAIRKLPLFGDLPERVSKRLFRAARVHHFGVGSVLFREGDVSDYLYLALDGHVCLKADGAARHQYVIEFVPAGQPFILAAVLLDKPFLMTAQIVQPGDVLLIPSADFRQCARDEISLSRAINTSAAIHWRALIGQLKSLKMQTGAQRLAAFLAALVEDRSGEVTVELPCDRQILATWLGMVPSSGSRAFRELSRIGVDGRGHHLRIRSAERLVEYARGQSDALPDRRDLLQQHPAGMPAGLSALAIREGSATARRV